MAIWLSLSTFLSKIFWKINRYIPLIRKFHVRFFSPDEPEFTLGYEYIKKGNLKEAENNFRICCKILPNKAECHVNLATCLALQGLKKEAINECKKAINIYPANPFFELMKKQIEKGNFKRIVLQSGEVVRKL